MDLENGSGNIIMKITTLNSIPPISIPFSANLLSQPLGPQLEPYKNKLDRINLRFKKKVREQDKGKAKEYIKLAKKFEEIYERKEIEKEKYETALKNAPKMSSLSNASATFKFRRF